MAVKYDKAVYVVTVLSTLISVIVLFIIAIISDNQSNSAQNDVFNLAVNTMILELPGQSCNIPNVMTLVNGSYCQPLSTGAPTYYDFVNYNDSMPMCNALINCNVASIIDIHDQTNVINKQASQT